MTSSSKILVLNDNEFNEMFDVSLLKTVTKTSTETDKIVDSSATKSDKIRQLLASGMKRGEVAKLLNIRYQHVRNVELMPLKRK